MAKINYGRTVWGAYFLETLNSYYNYATQARIARGKTYANSGRIQSIIFKEGGVQSKVTGNYDPFYKIQLTFPLFTDQERESILEIIQQNPLILSDLMNHTLSEQLLTLLTEHKIDLFPSNWKNLKRKCSCPDWGDPCKHMAGVYYKLTEQIDHDPFILFKLRGLDLVKRFNLSKDLEIPHPLTLNTIKSPPEQLTYQYNELSIPFNDASDFILSHLKDNPLFYQKNFKEVLEKFYQYSKRFSTKVISRHQDPDIEIIEQFFKTGEIDLKIDQDISKITVLLKNPNLSNRTIQKIIQKYANKVSGQTAEFDLINSFNLWISFNDSSKHNMRFNYFYWLFRLSLKVIENNHFIIAVVDHPRYFQTIFTPLTVSIQLQKEIKNLNQITPFFIKPPPKKHYLDQSSTTHLLLSSIITSYVKKLDLKVKVLKNRYDEKIINTIFKGENFQKRGFDTKQFPHLIDNYFSIFKLLSSNHIFSLQITADQQSYNLSLLVNEHHISDQRHNYTLLKFISVFKHTLPEITLLLKQKEIQLSRDRLSDFITNEQKQLMKLGVQIILPKELKELLKPRVKLSVKSSNVNFKSFLKMRSLLEFDYKIALGDAEISVEAFQKLVDQGQQLVEFKDQFVLLDPSEVKNILHAIEQKKSISKFDLLKMNFNDKLDLDEDLKIKIDDIFTYKNYPLPEINATLRDYQIRGINWGLNNLLNGFGIILADDMGLGKTIQAITILKYLKINHLTKHPALVILPTSLTENWIGEIKKFAPDLTYCRYYGKYRKITESDIVVTTYHTLIRRAEAVQKIRFDTILIDEAQKIKNSQTSMAKSIKSIKGRYKIALSGTPVENNLSELWSIFDFSLPKYLGKLKKFQTDFARPIERNRDQKKIIELKNITAPFMIRRLKTDQNIAEELPEKIVTNYYVNMKEEQAALYSSVVNQTMEQIDQNDESPNSGLIFKLITSLKQICNHPGNFNKQSDLDIGLSGKTEAVVALLKDIALREEKTLIFTQYTRMGDILSKIIEHELFIKPLYLKGSTRDRGKLVEQFQNDPKCTIFIVSLKAGGTGLNLTAANNVIHFDLWFNPAVENQATDRAFRIGQRKNVNVFRLITKNSFEEKIDKMISSKMELTDLTVSIGEKWIGKMDREELKEIFL